MTRKKATIESILARKVVRKRTARRYYQRALAAFMKTPAYAKYKAEQAAQSSETTENKESN